MVRITDRQTGEKREFRTLQEGANWIIELTNRFTRPSDLIRVGRQGGSCPRSFLSRFFIEYGGKKRKDADGQRLNDWNEKDGRWRIFQGHNTPNVVVLSRRFDYDLEVFEEMEEVVRQHYGKWGKGYFFSYDDDKSDGRRYSMIDIWIHLPDMSYEQKKEETRWLRDKLDSMGTYHIKE